MLTRLRRSLHRLFRDNRGNSAVEYGMILAGVAALIVVVITSMGSVVQAAYKSYCDSFTAVSGISGSCAAVAAAPAPSTPAPSTPAPSTPAPATPPSGGGDNDDDDDHGH